MDNLQALLTLNAEEKELLYKIAKRGGEAKLSDLVAERFETYPTQRSIRGYHFYLANVANHLCAQHKLIHISSSDWTVKIVDHLLLPILLLTKNVDWFCHAYDN